MKITNIALLCTFPIALISCKTETKSTPSTKDQNVSYSVCTNGDFTEAEFSDWVPITDMQLTFDNPDIRPKGTYWAYMEGRNNNGLDEYRWVQKDFPKQLYSRFEIRSAQCKQQFLANGLRLRKEGYDRVSLQVFIDGSGQAMHQSLWLKPKIKESNSANATESKPMTLDEHHKYEPGSTFQNQIKPIKPANKIAVANPLRRIFCQAFP